MKKILLSIFSLLSFISFAEQVPFKWYKNDIHTINSIEPTDSSFTDFEFLKEAIGNKKIVVLGESSHSDGYSFLAKTRLIHFLIKEMNFSILGIEGGGVLEIAQAKENIKNGANFEDEIRKSWYPNWSYTKQIIPLFELIKEHKELALFGVDNQFDYNYYSYQFAHILKHFTGDDAFKNIDFDLFDNHIIDYIKSLSKPNNNHNETLLLKKELAIIKHNINDSKSIAYQGILNFEGFIKQMELQKGSYEQQNLGISLRDSLMANNVKWYLDKNPNDKIIIWTANFHGTRNLDNVEYKPNDNFYQVFKSMTSRLIKTYDNEVYSIAFSSVNYLYPENNEVHQAIDSNSWDFELSQHIDNDYAFIDYSNIRKSKKKANHFFYSTTLGYKNRKGDWFNIFDGIFYIKNNCKTEWIDLDKK